MQIDETLVLHCAPTLAGLKMAALVCMAHEGDGTEYCQMVEDYNARYNEKGLYFRTLCQCNGRNLLYVYRRDMVASALHRLDIQEFLSSYGYRGASSLDDQLDHLSYRFDTEDSFPHELGVFLGYPLGDVKAFIDTKGAEGLLTGEWKVYTDVHFAEREFSRYRSCRRSYMDLFSRGFSMDRLIIA